MSNQITRLFSITTQSKRIVVNEHSILSSSREVIFTKNNRHYCTVWTAPQRVDALIEEFLAKGAITDFQTLTVI